MKIRVESVSKVYQDADRALHVLRDVSFELPSDIAIAIVGRSGIGKSTLLQVLGGLDDPTSGKVWYDDVCITSLTESARTRFRGRHVGFVFQFHHLLPEFTAVENVAMPLIIAGSNRVDATKRARTMLERVGLSNRMTHRPGQLSGGEQQRVAIARALIGSPSVVLADEATGNLDVDTGRSVQDVLRAVQQEDRCTMILVTHNLELAASMDMVLEMSPGGALAQLASKG